MCSLNGDHKSKLPRPCTKSNGARASEHGRLKGKPKGKLVIKLSPEGGTPNGEEPLLARWKLRLP